MSGVKKRSKWMKYVILIGSLTLGFALILYPLVSQVYYDRHSKQGVDEFRQLIENYEPLEEKEESIRLAEAYNEAIEPNLEWVDPYGDEERAEGVQTYADMLKVKEKIGIVKIPKIKVELPLYAGTSEEVLQKGVGHLEGTSLPTGGENTHSVVTAHRGLPEARLFTDLVKLEEDDIFSVETMAGELFYKVDQIEVVEPTETDTVKVVEGKDYVTLLTCTPYMINTHRLLVRGERTDPLETEEIEQLKAEKSWMDYFLMYWYYFLFILLAILFIIIRLRKDKNKTP